MSLQLFSNLLEIAINRAVNYGLFTFTDPDSDFYPNSDPIPLLRSWDWNVNLTLFEIST